MFCMIIILHELPFRKSVYMSFAIVSSRNRQLALKFLCPLAQAYTEIHSRKSAIKKIRITYSLITSYTEKDSPGFRYNY